jgi:hypothetical protein|tara:strand:+ start:14145 stop:14546 length:402 start_codon:yes stop_codon:yes gene_type:complete
MKNIIPEFKQGDTVTFCAYPDQLKQDLKCKVTKVEIDEQNKRVLYHLSGSALSITTGSCIKESKLFTPWAIAWELVNLYQLEFNLFKSGYIVGNLYRMRFNNSLMELLIRFDSGLVELFDIHGNLLQSESFEV